MATKHNDGCFQKAEDDEPLFTLLARDPLAPDCVRMWADHASALRKDPERIAEAYRVADEMEEWRRVNRPSRAPTPSTEEESE